jgi:hypothetical protein
MCETTLTPIRKLLELYTRSSPKEIEPLYTQKRSSSLITRIQNYGSVDDPIWTTGSIAFSNINVCICKHSSGTRKDQKPNAPSQRGGGTPETGVSYIV